MRSVPENFTVPTMTLQTLITFWLCGSKQPHCPPLKYAKARDFPKNKKTMQVKLCQMKRMMREVFKAGRICRFNFDFDQDDWTVARATRLYEMTHQMFAYLSLKRHKRRLTSILWKTYHNELIRNKGRLVGEIA